VKTSSAHVRAVTSRGVCRIALTTKSEAAFVEEVRSRPA